MSTLFLLVFEHDLSADNKIDTFLCIFIYIILVIKTSDYDIEFIPTSHVQYSPQL